ncbi:MAG: nitrilase family protein [Lentimicrobiaceae bacterium]|nr:nitrilase family protein [Lentimicrobiaceae bacterium]
MQNLTISIVQSDLFWENTQQNLDNFSEKISRIKVPTDLIVLPEMFSTGFTIEPENVAETMDGTAMQWLKNTALEKNCVTTGSLIIRENGNFYNRLVWMRPDGSYETYDKRHLFRMGNEHLRFSNGNKRLVTEINGWKIRPLICYDLRFPVWAKNSYSEGQYEYDLIIYVANWPGRRNFAWKHLLMARAIENQCYVAGINRIGTDVKGVAYQGNSIVLNFKGKPVIKLPPAVESIETVTLNYSKMQEFRNEFTVGLDWDGFEFKK